MESITLRKMEMKDIKGVLDIERTSFTIPWTRKAFEAEIRDNHVAQYLVVLSGDKVVAYGGMWLIVDEAHITNIAVHPRYRGRGIGKLLVEGLIEEGKKRGLRRMTLEVRRSNLVAQNLYKQKGFLPCGIRPGYYQDNEEDAIIMWKDMI